MSRLLNLPADTGPRRIRETMRWLEAHNLLTPHAAPDGKPGLRLLHPDGSGNPWENTKGQRYVAIPINMWTQGWIVFLSGRALTVFLALTELTGGTEHPDGELMDGYRKKQYGLSSDTWTRATRELTSAGLLRTTPVVWGDDDYEKRRRLRYRVLPAGLDASPNWSSRDASRHTRRE